MTFVGAFRVMIMGSRTSFEHHIFKSCRENRSLLVILKMGGAAITDKAGYELAREEVIWKLASASSQALQKDKNLQLIIVHGRGQLRPPARDTA